MPKPFRHQYYDQLRKQSIKTGKLFEDTEFPANSKSLFYSKIEPMIEWMRPSELCKVPKLIVEGVSCDDLQRGELGNTWFITACACLVQDKKLWSKVVPNYKDQEWDAKNVYAGIFHFNFWRYGEWIDVVIDDRLPVRDGKLIFCHSTARNEFWSSLLEKAYAKLYGDYESLMYGQAADALVDLTGGIAQRLDIKRLRLDADESRKEDCFKIILDAMTDGAIIHGRIDCEEMEVGEELAIGLVKGLGYTISDVKEVEISKSIQTVLEKPRLQLLRFFFPWRKTQWKGPFSSDSEEWKKLSVMEWNKMGITYKQEDEFWMSMDDVIKYITNIDINHCLNTSVLSFKKTWIDVIILGGWTASGRNGGGDLTKRFYLSNPQYVFDVPTTKETVMIFLEQKDVKGREAMLQNMNTIGYHILKVEENRPYRLHLPGEVLFSSEFTNSRSVFGRLKLASGRYVIIPATKEASKLGEYMLRMFSGVKCGLRELKLEGPPKPGCCTVPFKIVTAITVLKLNNLQLPKDVKGPLNPYLIIHCEGQKVTSPFFWTEESKDHKLAAIFYRKKPEIMIKIEVWNKRALIDDFLGEARCTENEQDDGKEKTFQLYGHKQDSNKEMPGTMTVILKSSPDLCSL